VLIVDQFEELFALGPRDSAGQRERDGFVEALHAIAMGATGLEAGPGALVAIAVRGNFLDQVVAYPSLGDAVGEGSFVVGR
jgi:hypothetical protein